jgi:hypothetical protein
MAAVASIARADDARSSNLNGASIGGGRAPPLVPRGWGMDGGKAGARLFQQIINQISPHAVFIEAFLGKGAVLRNKRVAERTIGVELDVQVIAEH